MAMKKVTVDGKTLNKRTADMLKRVQQRTGIDLLVVQGSYNKGVGASAGTHDGGGAVDISVSGLSHKDRNEVVWQMRQCGFASWFRPTIPGLWNEHIHAIAIGDKEMSNSARAQVIEYFGGGDGLVGSNPDPHPRPKPQPVWPIALPQISLERSRNAFLKEKKRKTAAVAKIQRLLNRRLPGEDILVDGIAGPKTQAKYKRWEHEVDALALDGVPSIGSLRKLCAGFYRVVK